MVDSLQITKLLTNIFSHHLVPGSFKLELILPEPFTPIRFCKLKSERGLSNIKVSEASWVLATSLRSGSLLSFLRSKAWPFFGRAALSAIKFSFPNCPLWKAAAVRHLHHTALVHVLFCRLRKQKPIQGTLGSFNSHFIFSGSRDGCVWNSMRVFSLMEVNKQNMRITKALYIM